MKRVTYFILLAAFALSVLGCKKEVQPIDLSLEFSSADQGVIFENNTLKISSKATEREAILILKEANGQEFSTESLICEFRNQEAEKWCTAVIKGKEIHVSATENEDKENPRKAEVSITCSNGLINPLGFSIEQAPKAKSNGAQILSFSLKEQSKDAEIDHDAKTVSISVVPGTDVTELTPAIEITPGATISPESGAAQDFTSPVTYTVTAEDGKTTAEYTVTVVKEYGPDADKAEFLTFSIKDQLEEAVIDNGSKTVSVFVPLTADLTALEATATFSPGATISPAVEEVTDFSSPVEFVLTSEDGTAVNTYIVTVTAKKNSNALVESFIVGDEANGETVVEGDIDHEAGTIVLNLPYLDKWPWGYTAKYEAVLSVGATAKMDFNNWDWSFASGATYTVTSEDETTVKEYIISSSMEKNPNAELVSLLIFDPETNGQPRGIYSVQIDNTLHLVTVNIKEGTDVSQLHIKIEASKGATTSWTEGETLNLNVGASVIVTSEDGEHSNTYTFQTAILKLSDFNLEMIDVEAAGQTFVFGDNPKKEYKKDYAQDVTLSRDFQISKFEITQDIFTALMGINLSPTLGDNYPITNINWYEAAEFCNRLSELAGLTPVYEFSNVTYSSYTGRIQSAIVKYDHANASGYRLPTSAEFEWAAKGGVKSKGYIYAGGDEPGEVAWYEGNSARTNKLPQPVGGKEPNELGLYDMSGNADEWVFDWKTKVPWGEIPDFADIDPIGEEDPAGVPTWDDYKVFRGGAASSSAMNVSVSETRNSGPGEQSKDRGFRIVITKMF